MSIFCSDKLGDPLTTRDKIDLLPLILVDMLLLFEIEMLLFIIVFIIYCMLDE